MSMGDFYNTSAGTMQRNAAFQRPGAGFAAPMSGAGSSYAGAGAAGAGYRYVLSAEESNVQFGAPFGSSSDELLRGTTEDTSINYDQVTYAGSMTALPKDLGKSVVLSRTAGNLHVTFASQTLDVCENSTCPVGKHDLIKDVHMDVYTTSKQPFVTDCKSISRHGDEHFYGNNEVTGTSSVAYTWMPSMFAKNIASADVLSRTITTAQRVFLQRFPGQTVDTLGDYKAQGMPGDKTVMVRYDPTGMRPSSAVTMWYDSLVDKKTGNRLYSELRALPNGTAEMPAHVYQQVEDIARKEISRYISLGDMTSKQFAIEIRPFPINGRTDLGLGDFEYHYPGVSPTDQVADPTTGELISAKALFEKTPITYSITFTGFYKKINDGSNSS